MLLDTHEGVVIKAVMYKYEGIFSSLKYLLLVTAKKETQQISLINFKGQCHLWMKVKISLIIISGYEGNPLTNNKVI